MLRLQLSYHSIALIIPICILISCQHTGNDNKEETSKSDLSFLADYIEKDPAFKKKNPCLPSQIKKGALQANIYMDLALSDSVLFHNFPYSDAISGCDIYQAEFDQTDPQLEYLAVMKINGNECGINLLLFDDQSHANHILDSRQIPYSDFIPDINNLPDFAAKHFRTKNSFNLLYTPVTGRSTTIKNFVLLECSHGKMSTIFETPYIDAYSISKEDGTSDKELTALFVKMDQKKIPDAILKLTFGNFSFTGKSNDSISEICVNYTTDFFDGEQTSFDQIITKHAEDVKIFNLLHISDSTVLFRWDEKNKEFQKTTIPQ